MSDNAVRFAPPSTSPFTVEVKREVAKYFTDRGLSDKGGVASWVRALVMLAVIFVPWGLVLGGVLTGWAALAACVVMGAGIAGVGFCVGHDAQHGSFSERAGVNRFVGLAFDLMGANGYLWRLTHNRIHHTYTNVHGLDEDIVVTPAIRLSPGSKRHWYHRMQHITCWPLYGLATVNWLFVKDFDYLRRKRLGPYEPPKYPRTLLPAVVLGKIACLTWQVLIPVLVLQPVWWQLLIGFLTMHMTAGLILGIIFQLAHVVEETAFPTADTEGRLTDTWAEHQMRTTADFARQNRLLGWYCGGLNFQIEHHLFPHVASEHYADIAPIVEACAKRHGLPYYHTASFWAAVGSHMRLLKRHGAPVAPVAQPQPA
jgi:linoleoyl-CoA desaturase